MKHKAVLLKDINAGGGVIYKKDTKFTIDRIKEYEGDSWTGQFRTIGYFKCPIGFTESGVNSMELYGDVFEILIN